MADLDTLRPEVRSALGAMVRADVCRDSVPTDAFDTIRAELLRLAKENADLLSTIDLDEQVWVQRDETMHRWIERARNAEAELASLKAKIKAAPMTTFRRAMLGTPHAWVEETFACPEWIGKHAHLLVEE